MLEIDKKIMYNTLGHHQTFNKEEMVQFWK
jgi:hypothetical protein